MGLAELIESRGVPYSREEFSLVLLPSSSMGSYNALPSSFVLLSMNVTHTPTRVRLYSTSQSVMLDASRATGSFDVPLGVGLATEVYFSSGTSSITFDPPVICSSVEGNPTFWYNISSSVNGHTVRFTGLPLGDPASTEFRSTVNISQSNVANTGNGVTGTITTAKTYLLLSASTDVKSRLRLYSVPTSEVPSEETTRAFGVFPPTGSKLIADLMLDTPNVAYPISPTLPALTWAGSVYQTGTGVTGYRLQNMSSTTPATISASISLYSLED